MSNLPQAAVCHALTSVLPAYVMAVLTIPVSGNIPPGLATISNHTVNAMPDRPFIASAMDTDQPQQTLAFAPLVRGCRMSRGRSASNPNGFGREPVCPQFS